MYGILLTIHILVSVLLIIAVLLQSGKGPTSAPFSAARVPGALRLCRSADFLNKATGHGGRVHAHLAHARILHIRRPTQSIMDNQTTTVPASPGGPLLSPAGRRTPLSRTFDSAGSDALCAIFRSVTQCLLEAGCFP